MPFTDPDLRTINVSKPTPAALVPDGEIDNLIDALTKKTNLTAH
jgi:hypothetical protein